MKKGFTLIELLAVITVLGILMIITVPYVNRNLEEGREKLYFIELEKIEIAARNWAVENASSLPMEDGDKITITLSQLQMGGYIESNINNPKTDELFDGNLTIEITKKVKNYEYKIIDN